MKIIAGFFTILILLTITVGCADDIVLEEEPSLKGNYTGKYIVSILSTQQSSEEFIIWQFEDRFFHMNLDPDKFVSKCFCSCFGEYTLTEGVRLKVVGSQPDDQIGSCTSCNSAENPDGTFVLDRSTATMKLTRQSGDTLKQLLLTPISID